MFAEEVGVDSVVVILLKKGCVGTAVVDMVEVKEVKGDFGIAGAGGQRMTRLLGGFRIRIDCSKIGTRSQQAISSLCSSHGQGSVTVRGLSLLCGTTPVLVWGSCGGFQRNF